MTTVMLAELLDRFDEMLDRTEDGEEIVIFHEGRAAARLLPPRCYEEDIPLPLRGFGQ